MHHVSCFSGTCCDSVTLGSLPDDLPNQYLKGTYTRNSTWLIHERNVYVNGNACMYWYGPQKRWFFNSCKNAGSGSRLSLSLLHILHLIFILHRAGHSSESSNACPSSKTIEWQFWDRSNFVNPTNLRPTCDIGR